MPDGPLSIMTDCPICGGTGWVCEEHPNKPREYDKCGGAGARCVCNPRGEVFWRTIFNQAEDRPPDESVQ